MSLLFGPPSASLFPDEQIFGQPEVDPAYRGPGVYARRRPEQTLLHKLVMEHLESWLASRREANPDDDPIPAYVEKAFRAYSVCGILCAGFSRLRCSGCGQYEILVALSCKTRGMCPSCGAKYMVQVGMHLTDHVLPRVPFTQFVVSFPKRIRYFLHHEPKHFSRVLSIVMRAIEAQLRNAAGAPKQARIAATIFPQRFGGSLNSHPHGHILASLGLFALDQAANELKFYPAPPLDDDTRDKLCEIIRRRVLCYLVKQGCLEKDDAEQMKQWDHHGGFSLDASVQIDEDDRSALERVARYCARHPFAKGRLERVSSEHICYQLGDTSHDGQTHITLSPFELLDRLAELVMPPRMHRNRYWGCLAPNSPLRPFVVLSAGNDFPDALPLATTSPANDNAAAKGGKTPPPSENGQTEEKPKRKASALWAMLIARIYLVTPILCPKCGAELKPVAVILDPQVTKKICAHVGEPTCLPTFTPARAPPQAELDFGA